jgi:methionyl-tRNA formyltransferase
MVDGPALTIVYFGTPEFAVPSLRALAGSRHTVSAVVSQPDRPKGRGHRLVETPTKALAAARGIPVLQPSRIRDEAFLGAIAAMTPDLGVVAAYGRILPEALLAIPRFGMINVHASLLPRYRGAAPIHRAVIDGQTETGITIMRVVKELDAGPMLATAHRAIGPDETSVEVERDLAEMGAQALVGVVEEIAAGRAIETPQNDSDATYASKIVKEESAADWTQSAHQLHNLVRGLQPWPLVSIRIDGIRCSVHRSRPLAGSAAASPGTIVEAGGDTMAIAAGGGTILQILILQPEGRRAMTAREFLAGHPVSAGTQVTS